MPGSQLLQVELTAAATKEPAPTNASQDTTAIRQELDAAQRKIVELEAQVSAKQSADTSVDSEAASALQAKLQAVSSELESANKKIGELQAQLVSRLSGFRDYHSFLRRLLLRPRARKPLQISRTNWQVPPIRALRGFL